MSGWIKLHRILQQWEWWHDDKMLRVFLTILLNANHEDGRWQGQEVKKGQWITGRKKLVDMTGISNQSIRTILKRLENSQEITIKSTSKFSVITVVNWHIYQSVENESTNKLTNDQPASNQQVTTNKNEKKEEKKNKPFAAEFELLWIQYPRKDGKKAALRHFHASVKTEQNLLDIQTALDNYKRQVNGTDKQYIKNGSTWFNDWQDFIETDDIPDERDWV